METIHGEECPRCGLLTLDIYIDDVGVQHGAHCSECGLVGPYVRNRIVELVA